MIYLNTYISPSWVVNVIDGILLITAHATDPGPGHTRSALYQYIYDPIYIYIVWLLEVYSSVLELYASYRRSTNFHYNFNAI